MDEKDKKDIKKEKTPEPVDEKKNTEPTIDVCKEDEKEVSQAEAYLNLAKQIQADFDNYRRRSLKALEDAETEGLVRAVKVFLPALDSFKKAKEVIKDKSVLEGVEMVERQINSSFESLGVTKIEAVGQKFNPNLHNALATLSVKGKPDGIVLEEYQTGYKLGDKVLKFSQVIVNQIKGE